MPTEKPAMIPTPSLDQLSEAAEEADRLVAAVRPGEWDAPTPCADWDVRALVGHLTGGNRHLAAALRGGAAGDARNNARVGAEGDDGDAAAAHRASVDDLLAAARAPGALERTVSIPFGTVPAALALHLRLTEFLVHGWDVARATGRPPRFPEPVVEQELAFGRAALAQLPPERRPFAPSQPVRDDAPAIDRLAALLGRRP